MLSLKVGVAIGKYRMTLARHARTGYARALPHQYIRGGQKMYLDVLEKMVNLRRMRGYYIQFNRRTSGIRNMAPVELCPELNCEEPLPSLDYAWRLARDMAQLAPDVFVNVRVVDDRLYPAPLPAGQIESVLNSFTP